MRRYLWGLWLAILAALGIAAVVVTLLNGFSAGETFGWLFIGAVCATALGQAAARRFAKPS